MAWRVPLHFIGLRGAVPNGTGGPGALLAGLLPGSWLPNALWLRAQAWSLHFHSDACRRDQAKGRRYCTSATAPPGPAPPLPSPHCPFTLESLEQRQIRDHQLNKSLWSHQPALTTVNIFAHQSVLFTSLLTQSWSYCTCCFIPARPWSCNMLLSVTNGDTFGWTFRCCQSQAPFGSLRRGIPSPWGAHLGRGCRSPALSWTRGSHSSAPHPTCS